MPNNTADPAPPPADPFHAEVFPEELAYVKARWQPAGSERSPDGLPDTTLPTVANGFVGLAFSGGGIRSATFNLGVLQALHRRGILKHVDYLSTVSGGGFLGASLTALMRSAGARFPFEHTERAAEPAELSYLRNHSNYLAPRGYLDWARLAGLLIRGILINVVILIPLIIVLSLAVSTLYRWRIATFGERASVVPWESFGPQWLTPWVVAGAVLWTVSFPVVSFWFRLRLFKARREGQRSTIKAFRWRDLYERTYGGFFTATLVAVLIDVQPIVIHAYHGLHQRGGASWTSLLGAASVVASLAAGKATSLLERHGRAVGVVVAGLLGPLLPFLGYLYLTHALAYDLIPPIFGYSPQIAVAAIAAAIFLFCYFLVDVNSTSMHGFYRDRLSQAYLVGADRDGVIGPEDDISLRDICQEGSGAPYHLFNAALNLQGSDDERLRGRRCDFFVFSKHFIGSERTGYCRTEHMEATFPHVHLGTAMAVSGAAASPNMGSFTSRPLVFLMATLNVRMGYWIPNPRWIAATVAKSGRDKAEGVLNRSLWRPGPTLLLREMLSQLDATGNAVNVSDGGHLENTGVYELLRRRCRFIIAGDGEGDPTMCFNGLADLLRYARIDLGVEIELDLDELRLGSNSCSRQHCAIGRIRYPARGDEPPEVGYLLYVKASLTDDEDEVIAQYRATCAEFPHESVADQFFEEGQFEAYRSLGYHIFDGLFEPLDVGERARPMPHPEFVAWFRGLAAKLSPRAGAEPLIRASLEPPPRASLEPSATSGERAAS